MKIQEAEDLLKKGTLGELKAGRTYLIAIPLSNINRSGVESLSKLLKEVVGCQAIIVLTNGIQIFEVIK